MWKLLPFLWSRPGRTLGALYNPLIVSRHAQTCTRVHSGESAHLHRGSALSWPARCICGRRQFLAGLNDGISNTVIAQ